MMHDSENTGLKLTSFVDPRHSSNTQEMSVRSVLKCYLYHVGLYGPNSCALEEDGIEVDPIEHITQESFDNAVMRYRETHEPELKAAREERIRLKHEEKRKAESERYSRLRAL